MTIAVDWDAKPQIKQGSQMGIWTRLLGLGQIDGLLVPPGKSIKLLTDHLITG